MDKQSTLTVEYSGFWSVVSEALTWIAETEVSLMTVFVLFAAYGARELLGLYFNWRTKK